MFSEDSFEEIVVEATLQDWRAFELELQAVNIPTALREPETEPERSAPAPRSPGLTLSGEKLGTSSSTPSTAPDHASEDPHLRRHTVGSVSLETMFRGMVRQINDDLPATF
ncbi:hypothetical protein K474DRAFT_1714215 [Panus rudis PR-1116 ss-1]|nr:hypothetical protein K474DRAFT_1714215 [Panus rudis PR-1116 ss-1]